MAKVLLHLTTEHVPVSVKTELNASAKCVNHDMCRHFMLSINILHVEG